jgi:hypothetical protein
LKYMIEEKEMQPSDIFNVDERVFSLVVAISGQRLPRGFQCTAYWYSVLVCGTLIVYWKCSLKIVWIWTWWGGSWVGLERWWECRKGWLDVRCSGEHFL